MRHKGLRRALGGALLCCPLLAPLVASQMPSPLVVLLGDHSRNYWIAHTPVNVGPVEINVWDDHTDVSMEFGR